MSTTEQSAISEFVQMMDAVKTKQDYDAAAQWFIDRLDDRTIVGFDADEHRLTQDAMGRAMDRLRGH